MMVCVVEWLQRACYYVVKWGNEKWILWDTEHPRGSLRRLLLKVVEVGLRSSVATGLVTDVGELKGEI
jgi:hypothetical protein